MIVKMKKAFVLVQENEAARAVNQLRSLGVLHVENVRVPQAEAVKVIREDILLVDSALAILSEKKTAKVSYNAQTQSLRDLRFVCRHIVDLHKRLDQLQDYAQSLKKQISDWEAWGDFDPDLIRRLEAKNIFIRFYQIPAKELNKVPAGVIVKKIFSTGSVAHCVVISHQKIEIPYKEIVLPKLGLEKMRARLFEDGRLMEIIQDDILKYTGLLRDLEDMQKKLKRELEFNEALYGMGKQGPITYLTGFVPMDAVGVLEEQARQQRWGLMVQEPGLEDNVPILLRNPRWVTLIRPVLNLLGVLPGYTELDVSFLFLVFFSMFFGILIGDAGYGLIYFALTFLLQKKRRLKDNNTFRLFYVLSSCAIIWGILTGTFFGQEWLLKLGLKPLVPTLNDPKHMQAVCFFIGALHLSIAHAWRMALKIPSLSAASDWGWICILWSAFFFARTLILDEPFPEFVTYLLLIGIISVVLFTSPQKNILKGIGKGLGTLALSLMNNFTDVVSYVRLFAVGMAGVAIAETTNSIASGLAGNPLITAIAVPLILITGHALNLILGPISVLVHGVRLNVLEFSGHAGVSWSGLMYKPLKERDEGGK